MVEAINNNPIRTTEPITVTDVIRAYEQQEKILIVTKKLQRC